MNTEKPAELAEITDVRTITLVRLAQDGGSAGRMQRIIPGYDAGRVAVAAFQSSI